MFNLLEKILYVGISKVSEQEKRRNKVVLKALRKEFEVATIQIKMKIGEC